MQGSWFCVGVGGLNIWSIDAPQFFCLFLFIEVYLFIFYALLLVFYGQASCLRSPPFSHSLIE